MTDAEDELIVRMLEVRNGAIDRLAAQTAVAFDEAGIESMVLKGPVLAAWLYPGVIRPYGDADLLVSPADWDDAVATLERLGFTNLLEPLAHPRMESQAGTAFLRDEENLDLHSNLHGLDADPERVWTAFRADSEQQEIGGATLRVPGKAAVLLHVGLHAAHHTETKPIEDLRRAIELADLELWQQAFELAKELDGAPTFASGLRRLPEGAELARQIGIDERMASTRHELRHEQVPMAEGLADLLQPGVGIGQRLRTVLREFFPRPSFMRWWSGLARRGKLGLIASYPWRWLWLLARAPAAVLAVLRTRRR